MGLMIFSGFLSEKSKPAHKLIEPMIVGKQEVSVNAPLALAPMTPLTVTPAVTIYLPLTLNNSESVTKMQLSQVKYWAYNIQNVDTPQQREQLVGTHFDLYVLETVTTEKGKEDFEIAQLVQDIRQYNIQTRNINPIILAYVDIGQAEDWRWYWQEGWQPGNPAWIVGEDPNGWAGDYPVAYWDSAWEEIAIDGYQGQSLVQATVDAGFDGIYMDWVEAFSDDNVVAKAKSDFNLADDDQARQKTAELMFNFIEKISVQAQITNPDYLIVAQNASDLYDFNPSRYKALMDGIALEAIWYDGDEGFDDWADSRGYNVPTNNLYPGWTEEVLADLIDIRNDHIPIFCAEYAQDIGAHNYATEVYETLAPGICAPYTTRRSLQQLSTTPYPKGYIPQDY
jgi:cysteinyl-tRNA synthetase